MTKVRKKKAGITRGLGPNPVDVFVGSRVKQRRSEIGMTQSDLGHAIGLTFQQVQKYERGQNRMGAGKLYDVAQTLEVAPTYFFDGVVDGGLTYDLPEGTVMAVADTDDTRFYSSEGTAQEAQEVARAFQKINRQKMRKKVIDLARSMYKLESGT